MGTDDQVNVARGQLGQHVLLLCRSPEPAQEIHPGAGMPEPLYDGVVVLLHQDCGRRQQGYLFVVRDRLESGSQAHLCFSVAHVTAQQPVHVPVAFHVFPDFLHALCLVWRQFPREFIFKLPLPGRIRSEGMARILRTFRVQGFQVKGQGFQALLDLALLPGPFSAAQAVQLRCLVRVADIALHPLQLFHRHIQLVVSAVVDQQVVMPASLALDPGNALVDTDAVVFMHHIVAHLQVREGGNPFTGALPALAPPVALAPDIRVGNHRRSGTAFPAADDESSAERNRQDHSFRGLCRAEFLPEFCFLFQLLQAFFQPLSAAASA